MIIVSFCVHRETILGFAVSVRGHLACLKPNHDRSKLFHFPATDRCHLKFDFVVGQEIGHHAQISWRGRVVGGEGAAPPQKSTTPTAAKETRRNTARKCKIQDHWPMGCVEKCFNIMPSFNPGSNDCLLHSFLRSFLPSFPSLPLSSFPFPSVPFPFLKNSLWFDLKKVFPYFSIFFPTCLVRVIGTYVSCRPPHPRPLVILVLTHEFWLAVFPARPQPRGPLGSCPRRTSTASAG